MISKEENEILTRVGPGTPMGALMRRYWIPALLSSELPEPDCPPVRVKLLGEALVAFRDSEGRVGFLDEFCAHRRASLFLGRNEEGGLRCVYHGWKYDVDGNCLDMPNEPTETNFRDKIHLKSYPAVEIGDVIWAYMGPKDKMPELPKFEWTQVPKSHRVVTKTWEECNWLQTFEGGVDTAHLGFLHYGRPPAEAAKDLRRTAQAPKLEVELTDYGFVYAGIRSLGEAGNHTRVYQCIMPFHKYNAPPSGKTGDERGEVKKMTMGGHAWTPMDDENTMAFNISYSVGEHPLAGPVLGGTGLETVDIKAGFRKRHNKDNDWDIDRQAQKSKSYTGIEGIAAQDHAVQESMGPIVDRSEEHLGSTDKAVVAARLILLRAVRAVQAGGDPPGVGSSYYWVRPVERVLPRGVRWQDALNDEVFPQRNNGQ
jgi:phenylpropionate dioxygenase-like ring-hydroxylating dioxygenase large terminal subunit